MRSKIGRRVETRMGGGRLSQMPLLALPEQMAIQLNKANLKVAIRNQFGDRMIKDLLQSSRIIA